MSIPQPPVRVDREAQARAEVASTAISPATAWAMIVAFLLLIAGGSVGQVVWDGWRGEASVPRRVVEIPNHVAPAVRQSAASGGGAWDQLLAGNDALHDGMSTWEDELKNAAFFRPPLLAWVQALQYRLGVGNEQAYPGRDGWLFYRPGIEHLCQGPFLDPGRLHRLRLGTRHADPRPAILAFAQDLSRRGIRLVLVPVPDKAQVHPDRLSPGFLATARMLRNPSELPLFHELSAAGITVVDLEPGLMAEKDAGRPAYLRTDTHWTPAAMRTCAALTASALTGLPVQASSARVATAVQTIRNHGDITVMLGLGDGQRVIDAEEISIDSVQLDGHPWTPDSSASVLLLGDSFANIYHYSSMGWGSGAGFAEHLSLSLGRRIDLISRNGAGALATRQALAEQMRTVPARFTATKVVVWEFAMRELSVGDWKPTPLPKPEQTTPQLIADGTDAPYLEDELAITVQAVIASISLPPGRTLDYQNFVRELVLDRVVIPGRTEPVRILARVLAVERRKALPSATWSQGQRIHVRLRPFDEALQTTWGSEQGSIIEGKDVASKLAAQFWIEDVLP